MKMRFRTDGSYFPKPRDRKPDDHRPLPVPGDVWRIVFGDGETAGYAICCPKCQEIHYWTSANNCDRSDGGSCVHEKQHASCWTWTGSAEANTLTANPSLHASGACGWHGWLRDGVLSGS